MCCQGSRWKSLFVTRTAVRADMGMHHMGYNGKRGFSPGDFRIVDGALLSRKAADGESPCSNSVCRGSNPSLCIAYLSQGEKCLFLSRTQTQENFLSSVWLAGASVVYLFHKAGHPIALSCKLDGPKQ